ncbi:FAD:protein FMN transferase [Acutalibacter sp.]|uniref:FAD:protein FMN transferase n=1 Tax=Acutalibacter sp. TaxID=1918636 RepID=UPI0021716D78|nr:FAD:protein FMN transferase [Acutalibacter sp.]
MTRKAKARLLWAGLFLSVLGLAAVWFLSQNREAELQTFAMGSYVRQTVWGPGGKAAMEAASQAVADLENRISWRREDGDIAQVNRQAGQRPVPVEPETLALLEQMRQLSEASGGAFDVTIGPVAQLWDFDSGPHLPEAGELEAALALVGYDRLLTGGDALFELASVPQELFDGDAAALEQAAALLDPGMALDLGAVGKGAACDAALAQYQEAGVKGAVIAVGGSIGLYGQKPDGKAFRVSVRDPEGQGSLGVLELPGGYVSTSGSYEKYFEQNREKYHHILDPRTGYPAESGLVSVTVWCPPEMDWKWPGALSDGLATACFVLGLEDGQKLLEGYGAEGIFVDGDGAVAVTPGLEGRFSLTAPGYHREAGAP